MPDQFSYSIEDTLKRIEDITKAEQADQMILYASQYEKSSLKPFKYQFLDYITSIPMIGSDEGGWGRSVTYLKEFSRRQTEIYMDDLWPKIFPDTEEIKLPILNTGMDLNGRYFDRELIFKILKNRNPHNIPMVKMIYDVNKFERRHLIHGFDELGVNMLALDCDDTLKYITNVRFVLYPIDHSIGDYKYHHKITRRKKNELSSRYN